MGRFQGSDARLPGNPNQGSRGRVVGRNAFVLGLLCVVAAGVSACGEGSSATTTTTTSAAGASSLAEMKVAAHAMSKAQNFTLAGTVTTAGSSTPLSGQFQAPDVVALQITGALGVPINVLFVGSKSYVKSSTGAWQRKITSGSGTSDPRAAFAVLDQATGVTAVQGADGQVTYRFTLPASAAAKIVQGASTGSGANLSGSAVVTSGLITDLMIKSVATGKVFSADLNYSAVGTSPPVVLPPGA